MIVKFIHAQDNLSLQTHPTDAIAKQRHGAPWGKRECWYVMDATPGARVLLGFLHDMSRAAYRKALQTGHLPSHLSQHRVAPGDVFFVAPGQIHGTLGGSLLLAEVQQSSDLTYRIFDYGRVEDSGAPRALHVEAAEAALNFSKATAARVAYDGNAANIFLPLVRCTHFTVSVCRLTGRTMPSAPAETGREADSFCFYLCVSGVFLLRCATHSFLLQRGETLFLPACMPHPTLAGRPSAMVLACYVEAIDEDFPHGATE